MGSFANFVYFVDLMSKIRTTTTVEIAQKKFLVSARPRGGVSFFSFSQHNLPLEFQLDRSLDLLHFR